MDWYFKELFHDRRFRIAVIVGGSAIVAIVLAFLIRARWAMNVALYGFFPILALSIVAIFVVLGLIVRSDCLERKATTLSSNPARIPPSTGSSHRSSRSLS